MMAMVVESSFDRRLRLVRQHGYNGLALLTLYDGWRYFESPGIDGFVPFELHRRTAVACGDPVCAESDLPALLTAFAAHCQAHRWRFAFVGATDRVARVASQLGLKPVKVGEEPLFDLSQPLPRGDRAKRARWAINRARRSGVCVEEYCERSPVVDAEIAEVSAEWLSARKGTPLSFLLRSRPLALREEKRIFIARHEERIVGVIVCSPARARMMMLVEELPRRSDAPFGTSELLIDVAREAARRDGYALFSLGVSPLQGAAGRQPYGRFRLARALAAACCSCANVVYSFRLLNRFKKKFAPTRCEDSFLIYQDALLSTALAVITAFSPEGIPSLLLPRRLQWLRVVPVAALWFAAVAGLFVAGFAAWQFPALQAPLLLLRHGFSLARSPADLMQDAGVTVFAHRMVSLVVVLVLAGGVLWRRQASA
jgi:lysylphosphatidylglycerol synthetase-like protein (DUF2156 family)